jgi:hypothetical protein
MGLLNWMARKAVKYVVAHPPSSPEALERRHLLELSVQITQSALRQAASVEDDETAAAALRDSVKDGGVAVLDAIEDLGDPRDNFLYDRSYRLLTAAVDGSPVRPIDPTIRDLFLAEERLGRLPLKDAFVWLAQMEPRLLDLEGEVRERHWDRADDPGHQVHRFVVRRAGQLVGFGVRGKGWLIRSDIAEAVVLRYLLAVAGTDGGDETSPLFARPGAASRGILLWGLKRPAATN